MEWELGDIHWPNQEIDEASFRHTKIQLKLLALHYVQELSTTANLSLQFKQVSLSFLCGVIFDQNYI